MKEEKSWVIFHSRTDEELKEINFVVRNIPKFIIEDIRKISEEKNIMLNDAVVLALKAGHDLFFSGYFNR